MPLIEYPPRVVMLGTNTFAPRLRTMMLTRQDWGGALNGTWLLNQVRHCCQSPFHSAIPLSSVCPEAVGTEKPTVNLRMVASQIQGVHGVKPHSVLSRLLSYRGECPLYRSGDEQRWLSPLNFRWRHREATDEESSTGALGAVVRACS